MYIDTGVSRVSPCASQRRHLSQCVDQVGAGNGKVSPIDVYITPLSLRPHAYTRLSLTSQYSMILADPASPLKEGGRELLKNIMLVMASRYRTV